jgi:hypothetical protein
MDLLVKAITILVLGLLAVSACASIGRAGEGLRPAMDANRLIVEAADWDWQGPQSLPPRFRNHCSYDSFTAAPIAPTIAASTTSSITARHRSAAAASASAIATGTASCAAIRDTACQKRQRHYYEPRRS